MDSSDLFVSIAIGVAIGGFIYGALARGRMDPSQRKALAIGSFSVGAVAAWFLYKRPWVIPDLAEALTHRGVLVVFAALGAAALIWKIRSLF